MPPQQYPPNQPYTQPPQQPGQYDFILSPQQHQPRQFGRPKNLLFLIGTATVVIVLLVIVLNLVRGGGGDTKPFVTVVQRQQEIVRIAALQSEALQSQTTRNFVATTELGLQSDQEQLVAFLKERGVKISKKEIATTNRSVDKQLTDAISTSTLDSTLTGVLQNQLEQYQSALSQAYQGTNSKSARALLVELNQHAELLLDQSKQ
jgi:hypothetical protein